MQGVDTDVASAWGDYLNSFRWAHFATLTPKFPDTAAEELELHFHNQFIRKLARATQRPVPWFYVMERSGAGVLHMHALVANTELLAVTEVRRHWTLGVTQIKPYFSGGAAAWYMAKTLHLASDGWERWDISSRLPSLR